MKSPLLCPCLIAAVLVTWHGRATRHGVTMSCVALGHGRATWHGVPVPNFCLPPGFASRVRFYPCCLAPPTLRGTPYWLGLFKDKFWASFGLFFT